MRKRAAQRAVLAAEARVASRLIEDASRNVALGLIHAHADFADVVNARAFLIKEGAQDDLRLPLVLPRIKCGAHREREVGFDLISFAVVENFMDVRDGGEFKLTEASFIAVIDGLGRDADSRLIIDIREEVEGDGATDSKLPLPGTHADEGMEVIQVRDPLSVANVRGRPAPIRQCHLRLKSHRIFPRLDEPRYIENPGLGRG